ncbi:DNA cytosine methyltransferase [Cedecea davisae]|uniref:DNA cytosine methyltransferase n=1 Tax=Cedecea davisae TaxID=158484 RepID=A0ABS6DKL7_9ENTR|nr:DNA cytosine methyltransferase [Cedecea davisae]MBU4683658.1 DNA cytosine methyltransferase [Cedecea davisae]MBU4685408.1 DNA cytosine methyltransferase [Cedecea davisae]
MSKDNKYKIIDLFCGAGGLSCGFLLGESSEFFRSILAIDNDAAAIKTYNANFGDHGVQANIEEWITSNTVPQADIVIGGPPCQGFSLLNKKRAGDQRRALWEPYMDIIELSNSSMFVMENVPGLLTSEEFTDITARAQELGFTMLNPSVLNMADYGVPQTRKRAIAIGIKLDKFELDPAPVFPPEATHRAPDKAGDKLVWSTVSDAIRDLPEPVGTEFRDEPSPLNLHFGRNPTQLSQERYRAVPPGGNRFDLHKNRPDITPNCWIRKTSGGTDLFGRLWWDRPSVTIRTEFFKPEKGRYLHPDQHRPITHREAARLMTFSDSFSFVGSKIEVARQIGNAVPPRFASVIAEYVYDLLSKRKIENIVINKEHAA